MYVSHLIDDFLEHLEVEKGRASHTTDNYSRYLARFYEIASELVPEGHELKPQDITPELLRKYRLRLNRYENFDGKKLSAITQAYHLIALRGFLAYLAKRNIDSLDPSLVELPHIIR